MLGLLSLEKRKMNGCPGSPLAASLHSFLQNISGMLKREYDHRQGNLAKSGTDKEVNEWSSAQIKGMRFAV